MDSQVTQLRKNFYQQVQADKKYTMPEVCSTLSLLTEEELKQIEQVWVELAIWKKSQSH
ncbi:hypothetical protein [Vibrio quintilis]|uniref:3-demethylubiquinone-9 3-methyltransferase n=1 Tax=Vibrio quintilis TaxID=1117707 RepID=A0A1M7YUY3_9VIBR|nr:hypothetical protein [Vibrio quintilis]SHO56415.1 hypothetical protein VQ7734_02184 [Vibrio quintilis]